MLVLKRCTIKSMLTTKGIADLIRQTLTELERDQKIWSALCCAIRDMISCPVDNKANGQVKDATSVPKATLSGLEQHLLQIFEQQPQTELTSRNLLDGLRTQKFSHL